LHQLFSYRPEADVGGAGYNLFRRMRRIYSLAALLAIAALSSMPASAQASKAAWQDCKVHGGSGLTGHYTIAQLNTALRTMPAYVEEYSNCYGVIQAQLLKQQLKEKPRPKAYASSDRSSGGGSTGLIVAIVVVAIGGLALAFWASRRRRGGSPPADGPPAT
jgi:hypothetical protein